MTNNLRIISGTANQALSKEVAEILKTKLCPVEVGKFSDGETYVHFEESVRGGDVYVIQPTCPPVNEHLMELLIMVDALKRSSPSKVTVVMPYYGYSRQDKKIIAREPIGAKLVADMIEVAGADRVIMFDLHAAQIQGFFDIATDHIEHLPFFAEHILDRNLKDVTVVSPDAGGVANARKLAKLINAPLAIIDKRRPKPNAVKVGHIIGDVKEKNCVIVDDLVDTAGTIVEAARVLKKHKAKNIFVYATHGVLSGPAITRINSSAIKQMIITNSIPLPRERKSVKIKVVSIAPIIAETIRTNHQGVSMGVYFDKIYDRIEQKSKKVRGGLIEKT